MNKIFLFSGIFALICFSCSMDSKKKSEQNLPVTDIATHSNILDSIVIPSDSGIVHMSIVDGKGYLTVRKKEDQVVYIEFLSTGNSKVKGHLSSPDSLANIRFSQIIMPDGTMDGPFGRDIEYAISQNGYYKISVHENMMAGDPWGGVFHVKIEID